MRVSKSITPYLLLTLTLTGCVEPPSASSSPAPFIQPDAPSDLAGASDQSPDFAARDLSVVLADQDLVDQRGGDLGLADMNTLEDMHSPDASLDKVIDDADMALPPEDMAPPVYGSLECEESDEAATMLYEGSIEIGQPFSIETNRLRVFLTSAPVISISPLTSVTVSSPQECGDLCRRRTFTIGQANDYTLTITNSAQDKILQTCIITF